MYLSGSLAVALPLLTSRQVPNSDFIAYPDCALTCAEENSVESCYAAGASDSDLATCYCPLVDFQKAWAQCCYKSCSTAEFNLTADDFQDNCDINGSPSPVSKAEWIAYGEGRLLRCYNYTVWDMLSKTDSGSVVTVSASTPTGSASTQQSPSSSSSGSNNNNDSNGTLSTAALIGTILVRLIGLINIIVGLVIALETVLLKSCISETT
jgi:hypothetical protein